MHIQTEGWGWRWARSPRGTILAVSGCSACPVVTILITQLIFRRWRDVCCYYPHCTDGKLKAQRGTPLPCAHPSGRQTSTCFEHTAILPPPPTPHHPPGQFSYLPLVFKTRFWKFTFAYLRRSRWEPYGWGRESGYVNLKMPNMYFTAIGVYIQFWNTICGPLGPWRWEKLDFNYLCLSIRNYPIWSQNVFIWCHNMTNIIMPIISSCSVSKIMRPNSNEGRESSAGVGH